MHITGLVQDLTNDPLWLTEVLITRHMNAAGQGKMRSLSLRACKFFNVRFLDATQHGMLM